MGFTSGMVPMLPSRIVQLTLFTSLVFGAVSTVFSAPLTAEAQQDLPATIPSLSGYDGETRRSMELACISEKGNGPVAYGTCLDRQIASLQGTPGIPSLSGYDSETRRSMELACISEKGNGPVAYASCLNRQIASLQGASAIPNLSGHEGETQQTAPRSSTNGGANAGASRSGTTAVQSADPMSRFTSENVLKVHQGMSSKKILEMFGAPKNVSQAVCGASVGKPWACTTWEYGDVPYEWASFTFSGGSGSLILNSFDVHRK